MQKEVKNTEENPLKRRAEDENPAPKEAEQVEQRKKQKVSSDSDSEVEVLASVKPGTTYCEFAKNYPNLLEDNASVVRIKCINSIALSLNEFSRKIGELSEELVELTDSHLTDSLHQLLKKFREAQSLSDIQELSPSRGATDCDGKEIILADKVEYHDVSRDWYYEGQVIEIVPKDVILIKSRQQQRVRARFAKDVKLLEK